jgi:two-component system sensor histidine kinase BaeS
MARDLPPVHADPDSVHQIVLSLVSNAALASEPGTGIELCASVEQEPNEAEEQTPYLRFSITDTGGGVAPADRRHVFQGPYQGDNVPIEGLGEARMGLSVAKALVEANGGRLWAESGMGAGTTFSFILPLSAASEGQDSTSVHAARGSGE